MTIPTLAKWASLVAGLAYTGFVTTAFEQHLGWHLAPIGLMMIIGALSAAVWIERRLR